MGSIVVGVVLPFLKLHVEEVDVVDDLAFEESVELFGVDSVGSFDLSVEPGCGGFDVDVADAFVEQVSKADWTWAGVIDDVPETFNFTVVVAVHPDGQVWTAYPTFPGGSPLSLLGLT